MQRYFHTPADVPSEAAVFAIQLNERRGVDGTLLRLSPRGTFWQSMMHPSAASVVFWGGRNTTAPWHVWLSPLGGGQAIQLTDGPGIEGHPFWFPDGRRIVYFASAATCWEMARQFDVERATAALWILDIESGQRRQLTCGDYIDERPAVSPDLRSIAFVSNRSGSMNLWHVGVDGHGLRQVTHGSGPDYRPYFAPDGTRIAYFSRAADGSHQLRICTWPDGGAVDFPCRPRFRWVHGPCWSADGRTILVHAVAQRARKPRLWLIDVVAGTARPLRLPSVPHASHASWDRAEQWLAVDCRVPPHR